MDEPTDPFADRPDRTDDLRSVLIEVATSVLQLVGSPEVARQWERPAAIDGMSVGGLASHIVVALRVALVLLDQEKPSAARIATPLEFFGDNRRDGTSVLEDDRARAIVASAEDGATGGHAEVVNALAEVIAEVDAALGAHPSGDTIATRRLPDAVARLDDYLLTRIAEVVLHGDDLAYSVGVTWHPPVPAADATIELLVDMARERIGDIEVLRALAREERAVPGAIRAL